MTTAIVPQTAGQDAISRPVVPALTREDVETLKATKCKDATDSELKLFMATCSRTGLDPFANQIHFVKRGGQAASFQVGIDGFRLVAERTGKYAGQEGPFWCGDDGVWKDVWLPDEQPVAARVGVIRTDFQKVLFGTAKFKAFAATTKSGELNSIWRKMPDLMIAKCAEALALRRAFPNELSGIYAPEEMAQSYNETPAQRITEAVKLGAVLDMLATASSEEELLVIAEKGDLPWNAPFEVESNYRAKVAALAEILDAD